MSNNLLFLYPNELVLVVWWAQGVSVLRRVQFALTPLAAEAVAFWLLLVLREFVPGFLRVTVRHNDEPSRVVVIRRDLVNVVPDVRIPLQSHCFSL